MSFFSGRRQSDSENAPDEQQQPSRPAVSQSPIGFETVLGAGSVMEGTLSCEGNVRLDGEFTGTLAISGNILVGETANIRADVNARNISVAGAVRGNIIGNKVQLLRTGRVWGDIQATALTTEEGAFIDGKITMQSHAAHRNENADAQTEVQEQPSDVSTAAETFIEAEIHGDPPPPAEPTQLGDAPEAPDLEDEPQDDDAQD